jgi:hypothetical protein
MDEDSEEALSTVVVYLRCLLKALPLSLPPVACSGTPRPERLVVL